MSSSGFFCSQNCSGSLVLGAVNGDGVCQEIPNAWVSFGLFHSITFIQNGRSFGTILCVLWDSRVLRSFPWRDSYSSLDSKFSWRSLQRVERTGQTCLSVGWVSPVYVTVWFCSSQRPNFSCGFLHSPLAIRSLFLRCSVWNAFSPESVCDVHF